MDDPEIESIPKPKSEVVDFCPTVRSFKTSQGSVYKKLPDGTFQRHKYDGIDYEPMDWTMFTDKEGEDELRMIRLKLQMMSITKKAIFFVILEFDQNGDYINRADNRNEILDPNNAFDLLTIEADGVHEPRAIFQTQITFRPKVGYTVFEFSNNGEAYHLGDLVSEIDTGVN